MDRMELEREMSETEVLDANSSRVAALLRALPRVEAPGNFEFGVRAKIAAGGRRSGWNLFPFFKVAAPLSLVLLIVASVIFYGSLPADSSGSPAVAEVVPERVLESRPAPAPVEEKRIDIPVPAPTTERAGGRRMRRVAAEPRRAGPVRISTQVQSSANRDGGSAVQGLTAPKVILPPGFESSQTSGLNSNGNTSNGLTGIPIDEILAQLGLKAKLVSGEWMVQSITQNSVGARSGVQVNDVIEALGDQVLGDSTRLKAGFDGKTLRIRRDGEHISLVIKN